jgi:hypothetical protein
MRPLATTQRTETKPAVPVLVHSRGGPALAIIAFLFGAAVMLSYRPWHRIEVGDPAFYDYVAQSILRGQLPYRDVVDIKGPGAAYLSAIAMAVGKSIGLRDFIAVRFMNVLLVGLLSSVTYLVAVAYLKNRLLGILAFLIPLMPEAFATMVTSGTQPKLLMILFGMITLLMISNNKPFWAGFFSMMSCLCWQPGLLFTGTAFLLEAKYLTRWRNRSLYLIVVGAAIPLLLVLGYFYFKGALGDLWAWTITYNYGVFGPEAKAGISDALDKLWTFTVRTFRPGPIDQGGGAIHTFIYWFETYAGFASLAMIPAALTGLIMFAWDRVRAVKLESIRSDRFTDALFFPPAIYLLFCLVNFQAGADLIPFFPFIGIFSALFFFKIGSYLPKLRIFNLKRSVFPVEMLIPAAALILISIVLLGRAITFREDQRTLQDQVNEFKIVADLLGPDDRIYVHGTIEMLVLLNRPNLNPYILLDWDADTFAAARTPGGWEAIMNQMESMSPKVVALSRLRAVTHRADLERWVNEHYDPLQLPRYERVFVRRP